MRIAAVLAALALALPAAAQDENGALKAYDRAVRNMNESAGYHVESKIGFEMGGAPMEGGSVEGVIVNPGFGHFKVTIAGNTIELFKEKDAVAIHNPQSGKWEEQSTNQTLDFFVKIFNLGELLEQLQGDAQKAEFGETEEIGKRECRTVEFGVAQATLKTLMEGKAQAGLGVTPENTTMTVKAWLDKKEKLPRQIRIVIDVELKGLPGAPDGEEWEDWEEEDDAKKEEGEGKKEEDEEDEIPPMKVAITVTAQIRNYGEDLKVNVPPAARKVLDAQKKTETEPGEEKEE